jgi:hypothetical protein
MVLGPFKIMKRLLNKILILDQGFLLKAPKPPFSMENFKRVRYTTERTNKSNLIVILSLNNCYFKFE